MTCKWETGGDGPWCTTHDLGFAYNHHGDPAEARAASPGPVDPRMPIRPGDAPISEAVIVALIAVRQTSRVNMLWRRQVQENADALGHSEAGAWLASAEGDRRYIEALRAMGDRLASAATRESFDRR